MLVCEADGERMACAGQVALVSWVVFFFFQAEDGIRDSSVTGVQTCALVVSSRRRHRRFKCDWSSDVCSSDLAGTEFRALHGTQCRPVQGLLEGLTSAAAVRTDQVRVEQRRPAVSGVVELVEDPSCAAGLKLTVSINQQWEQRAALAEGCYVLRTNLTQWDPHTLSRTYIQLTQAEAAFRIHKRDLSIRPIWHQKQSRVEAHILVCFLAYVLWKTLEQWQARAGLGNSPRTILDELGSIQSTDLVLPLSLDPVRHMRISCVVRPEPAQAPLLDRLGLELPKRLHNLPPD